MQTTFFKITNQLVIPSSDFEIAVPGSGGLFSGGLLSGLSILVSIFFAILIVIWIALSIYAGINIVRGYADQQLKEKGIQTIRNIWLGITSLVVFIAIISIAGSFIGFGNVFQWSDNLAQCNSAPGLYFSELEQGLREAEVEGTATQVNVYCCPESDDALTGSTIAPGWKAVPADSSLNVSYRGICEFVETVDLN